MLLLTLIAAIAAIAAAGCDDDDPIGLTEAEACKAVKEKLSAEQLEARFGEPTSTQDFFGDRVLSYTRGEVKWQFQVTTQGGTFRALQVKGTTEKILPCRA
jgi:hypothetical protein